ncbi:MAG TPA: hypothetical protein DEP42_00735 [Ruminococcaceae bacterium]|nr:hypothetical protein [Oscillospiraceae bacterium]
MDHSNTLGKWARVLCCLLPIGVLLGKFSGLSLYLMSGLMLLLFVLHQIKQRHFSLPLGRSTPYAVVLIWIAIYGAITLFWAWNRAYCYSIYLYQIIGIAISVFMCGTLRTRQHLQQFLDILTLCLIFTVCLGIVEIFTGNFIFFPNDTQLYWKNEYNLYFPYAMFDNTNDYATYVLVFLPFGLYHLVQRLCGVLGKITAFALLTAALFTIFNADPRILYIAMVFMGILFFICMAFKRGGRAYLRKLIGVAVAGMASIALLGAMMLFKASVFAGELHSINMDNHSVSERSMLLLGSLRMTFASHFLGIGVGNGTLMMPYFTGTARSFNPHNMTLQLLSEDGILVFIPYVLMMIAFAVRFFRYRGQNFHRDVLSAICFAMVCGYPLIGIASADMTHILAAWPIFGILLVCMNILYPAKSVAPKEAKKLLFISFIDFGDFTSGSSVRPQRMAKAFENLGYDVQILSGLQNRRWERWKRVWKLWRSIRNDLPDFCYVEPPSGPFFNFCDHLLLLWLRSAGVPLGLFYRDAYWLFADWWGVKGIKRFWLILMQRFDLFIFHLACNILFFPTKSMADLFQFRQKGVLPPAGINMVEPAHKPVRKALYVGGVSVFYGTDMLLEAFSILNEEMHCSVHLNVVCREKEMGELFEPYLGRAWLSVLHRSGDEALAPLYADCDMALYPSRPDRYMDFCMPVKLFEYLSRALPIVCTNCKEAAGFVEENGIGIVSPFNAKEYALAVSDLYSHPDRLVKMREQCIKVLQEKHGWEHRAAEAATGILKAADRSQIAREEN